MKISNYRDAHLKKLLEMINEAERDAPHFESTTKEDLDRDLFKEPGYDKNGHFLLFYGNIIVGHSVGVPQPRRIGPSGLTGWIDFSILPIYRRRELEDSLYERAERYLYSRKVGEVRAWSDLDWSWRLNLIKRLDFEEMRRGYVMEAALSRNIPPSEPPKGYHIRLARMPREAEMFLRVMNRAFEGTFDFVPVTFDRFKEKYMDSPYLSRSSFFFAEREKDNEVVGVNCAWYNRAASNQKNKRTGDLRGLGVIPEERNKGLGTSLVLSALSWLKSNGYGTSTLSLEAENRKALHIYESLGYRVKLTWVLFRKYIRSPKKQ